MQLAGMPANRGFNSWRAWSNAAGARLLRPWPVLAGSVALGFVVEGASMPPDTQCPMPASFHAAERQVTRGPLGRIVTHIP